MNKSIVRLDKKHYKKNGGTKYFIDCSAIDSESDSIQLESSLKIMSDISIIKAVINYSKHLKKNKHIVIKIAHKDRTNKKEYDISKVLQPIPVFIIYICLFDCFDDTYNYVKMNNKLPEKLCTAKNIGQNDSLVLIAPYINGGSIRQYKWNPSNVYILKSLLKQAVMSILEAYLKFGFIHNDLHLDNILLKKTKVKQIVYQDAIIDTNGYKIVIMDFESSFIGVNITRGSEDFWFDIKNLFFRVAADLRHCIKPIKYDNIINDFIRNADLKKLDARESIQLLSMIDQLEFTETTPSVVPTYNPFVF